MQISLDKIRGEPYRWRETMEVPPESLDRSELVALSPIDWSGQISWADPGYYLKARLRYEQTLACTRCLEPLVEPVDEEVELLLLVEPGSGAEEGERELEEEELGVVTLSEERIDTRPILREQLQLLVPMKPVCRADCKGLCPRCGTDLNSEQCSCEEKEIDPRWAALAGLRESPKDD